MIVWLNGAFGSGKTQTALEIHKRLPSSFVYDPENVGYFLRENEPVAMQKSNFQDEPLWRMLNFEMLRNIKKNYDGMIIVPMTLYDAGYYAEIIGKLRNEGIRVDHYVLGAREDTIRKRLKSRLEEDDCWAAQQIDICINGFKNPIFENLFYTDDLTIEQVARHIMRHSAQH